MRAMGKFKNSFCALECSHYLSISWMVVLTFWFPGTLTYLCQSWSSEDIFPSDSYLSTSLDPIVLRITTVPQRFSAAFPNMHGSQTRGFDFSTYHFSCLSTDTMFYLETYHTLHGISLGFLSVLSVSFWQIFLSTW